MAISSSFFTRCLLLFVSFSFYFSSSPQALPFSFFSPILSSFAIIPNQMHAHGTPSHSSCFCFFFLIGMYTRKTFFVSEMCFVVSRHGCGGMWIGLGL
jgi:hypothetical protein